MLDEIIHYITVLVPAITSVVGMVVSIWILIRKVKNDNEITRKDIKGMEKTNAGIYDYLGSVLENDRQLKDQMMKNNEELAKKNAELQSTVISISATLSEDQSKDKELRDEYQN